jgi:hypothetical protein
LAVGGREIMANLRNPSREQRLADLVARVKFFDIIDGENLNGTRPDCPFRVEP